MAHRPRSSRPRMQPPRPRPLAPTTLTPVPELGLPTHIPEDLRPALALAVHEAAAAVRQAQRTGGTADDAEMDSVYRMLRENPRLVSFLNASQRAGAERERAAREALAAGTGSFVEGEAEYAEPYTMGGAWGGTYTPQTWMSPTGRVTGMGSRWTNQSLYQRKDDADAVVSPGWLRKWSETDIWVRAAINTRRTQIGRSFVACVPRDELRPYPKVLMKRVNNLLMHPNEARQNWRELMEMVIEDLLVLDRGCVSKNLNARREPLALYAEDGATMRVYPGWSGDPDEPRYLYVHPDGRTRIPLRNDQLIMMMDNPGSHRMGLSPVQVLADVIESDLAATASRARQLQQKPPPLLVQFPGAQRNQIEGIRDYYDTNIAGVKEALFVGGEQPMQVEKMIYSARDNQMLEYQEYMIRQVAVIFKLAPAQFGAPLHASEGDAQTNVQLFEDTGLLPLFMLVEEYFNQELLGDFAPKQVGDPFGRVDLEALNLQIVFPQVGEMQRQMHAEKAAQLAAQGLLQLPSFTLNQILSMRGERLVDGGNTFYVNSSMGPVPWLSYDGNDPSLNPLMAIAGVGDGSTSSGVQSANSPRGSGKSPKPAAATVAPKPNQKPGTAGGQDNASGTGADNPPAKPATAPTPRQVAGGGKGRKSLDEQQHDDDRARFFDGRHPGSSWSPGLPSYQRLLRDLDSLPPPLADDAKDTDDNE